MSDAYQVGGVTVDNSGGGWYLLTGAGLPPEGLKVQGKEAADAKASEIDKAAQPPEGSMPPQGELTDTAALGGTQNGPTPAQVANQAEGMAKLGDSLDKPLEDDKETQNAALKGQLADLQARLAEMEKAAKPIVSVMTSEDDAGPGQVPLAVPREYAGQMDAKAKSAFKKAGINVVTIVLEESEHIPPTGLFIGHNGRSYMIKPGEEVDVPDFLVAVLDDAVTSAPVVDSASAKVLGYRNRSKYPYRVVKS